MRQLVTIQRINDIKPIEGRDRVEQGEVLGWTVIVGKDQFKNGDLVCYAETDSLFPKNEHWTELEKFRHRIKMFKVNSPSGPVYGQGFCFSVDKLESIVGKQYWTEGQEITNLLAVTKWELPEDFNLGDIAGKFPTNLVPQTDETRIQSVRSVIEEIKGKPYYITSKIDGTSATFLINPDTGNFLACSRNNMRKHPDISGKKCVYWDIAEKYQLEKVLKSFPHIVIQGEIYGPSIQGNKLKVDTQKLAIFNLWNLKKREYVNYEESLGYINRFKEISENIEFVPIMETGFEFNYSFEDILQKSLYEYPSGYPAEGIVVRPQVETYSNRLKGRLSFKCINPEFSCKEK